jgi:hypothetical protein
VFAQVKHRAAIRCLDLSASKNKLAVVDENSKVFIYDLITKEVTFEESNATSVAWNVDMEDMCCFSGNGMLSIKTGDFPLHRQKLQGFVVGFKASKIFCLHFVAMQVQRLFRPCLRLGCMPMAPITQSHLFFCVCVCVCVCWFCVTSDDRRAPICIHAALLRKEGLRGCSQGGLSRYTHGPPCSRTYLLFQIFSIIVRSVCFCSVEWLPSLTASGVTEADWRELAMETLLGLSLDIARKAFIRIRDVRYIELLNRIEIARKQKRTSAALAAAGGDTTLSLSKTTTDDTIFLADILAYQGRYDEASRLYLRCGQRKKAIEMFLDLRDWAKAKEIVEAAQAAQRDGMCVL